MLTYTSREVTESGGCPSLLDISVQLGRIPRFCGATKTFWPVLLHSFVVADLLPKNLEIHGLLHDSSEIAVGDIPGPHKPECIREFERALRKRIYLSLKLQFPSESDLHEVKHADIRSLAAEARVLGPDKFKTANHFCKSDAAAESLVQSYLVKYEPPDCLWENGAAVVEFRRRVRLATS
jgi:hypothetical protein